MTVADLAPAPSCFAQQPPRPSVSASAAGPWARAPLQARAFGEGNQVAGAQQGPTEASAWLRGLGWALVAAAPEVLQRPSQELDVAALLERVQACGFLPRGSAAASTRKTSGEGRGPVLAALEQVQKQQPGPAQGASTVASTGRARGYMRRSP